MREAFALIFSTKNIGKFQILRLSFYNFITKYTEIFCWKNERSFCTHFFNKKYWQISDIKVWNSNGMLTIDVVSSEQLGPELNPLSYQGS